MTPTEKLKVIKLLVNGEKGVIYEKIRDVIDDRDGKADDTESPHKIVKRFVKPTIEEVVEYCQGKKSTVDGEAFWYFYESKGWVIGKSPMKNWRMAVATWERKDKRVSKTELDRLKSIANEQSERTGRLI